MFKPLPVVRIRGRLTTNGANIQVLSVKAPKGAKITVKCSGKGCPRKSVATATKVTRISQFQRVLPARHQAPDHDRQARLHQQGHDDLDPQGQGALAQ